MRLMDHVCEACRRAPAVEAIENEEPGEPYRVCSECGERLSQRALRPLEWFNLAAIHSWKKHLLHDDFYDQDGKAWQPASEDLSVEGSPAPTLNEAARSLERLVDFCMTRWAVDHSEYEAFRAFDERSIAELLKARAEGGNWYIFARSMRLVANVLGAEAAPWVRGQYQRSVESDLLFSWAEAAAKCLPEPEGLRKTMDALKGVDAKEIPNRISALMWFRSIDVLNWIEANAPAQNVVQQWGLLASVSDLTWDRVKDWLNRGRPLSLIALDALMQCIPRPSQAPIVKEITPSLGGCPDQAVIVLALREHMETDDVPRVANQCRFVIENLDQMITA